MGSRSTLDYRKTDELMNINTIGSIIEVNPKILNHGFKLKIKTSYGRKTWTMADLSSQGHLHQHMPWYFDQIIIMVK